MEALVALAHDDEAQVGDGPAGVGDGPDQAVDVLGGDEAPDGHHERRGGLVAGCESWVDAGRDDVDVLRRGAELGEHVVAWTTPRA